MITGHVVDVDAGQSTADGLGEEKGK